MSISTKSGFMKPMVHCPDMAILKSPKQTMLEQLGLEGNLFFVIICRFRRNFQGLSVFKVKSSEI